VSSVAFRDCGRERKVAHVPSRNPRAPCADMWARGAPPMRDRPTETIAGTCKSYRSLMGASHWARASPWRRRPAITPRRLGRQRRFPRRARDRRGRKRGCPRASWQPRGVMTLARVCSAANAGARRERRLPTRDVLRALEQTTRRPTLPDTPSSPGTTRGILPVDRLATRQTAPPVRVGRHHTGVHREPLSLHQPGGHAVRTTSSNSHRKIPLARKRPW
jgi:hypothetical protein